MRVNYNISAMLANNHLSNTDDSLSASIQRLSSGLKINSAEDNPSGYAMAKRMNAQIEGLSVASQNASDGISVVETVDGVLGEMQSILQRINELSVKASTETMVDADRALVDREVQSLKEEITRISEDTQFNGQTLLDGTFDLKGYAYADSGAPVEVKYYSDETTAGKYKVKIDGVDWTGEDLRPLHINNITITGETGQNVPSITSVEANGNRVIIKGEQGFELTLALDASYVSGENISLDLRGTGAMTLQVGANENQTLDLRIPQISLTHMGIEKVNTLTHESADEAISTVAGAILYVSEARSRLGAYQNRLEHQVSNLDVSNENMTAAYSRITDVDMAEEMTSYSTYQVLSQAGTSMLAQANQRPQQVLQLLQ